MEVVKRTPGAQFTPAGVLKVPIEAQQPAALIAELQIHLLQLQTEEVATQPVSD
jgi:hypothetical protein